MKNTLPMRAQLLEEDNEGSLTIEIFDYIDPYFGVGVIELNRLLNEHGKAKEILVKIHSRGGNALEGFGMYTILAQHPATINIDIIGVAASAAGVVAMAGDRIRISETGFFHMHDAWLTSRGNAEQLRRDADRLDGLNPAIIRAYLRKSSATETQLREWMSAGGGQGTWHGANDALSYGFVDEIYTAPAPQNSVDLQDFEGAPPEAVALFGNIPKREPVASVFSEALQALGETPESVNVLSEALNSIGEHELTEPVWTEQDIEALNKLVAGKLEETVHE